MIFDMIYFYSVEDSIIYILRHYYILCTRLTSIKDINLPHGSGSYF